MISTRELNRTKSSDVLDGTRVFEAHARNQDTGTLIAESFAETSTISAL